MASINDTGVTRTTLDGYTTFLEDLFRTIFGDQVDLSGESAQGQFIGVLALSLSQSDDVIVAESQGYDPHRASGVQQDGLYGILNIKRRDGTRSTVPGIVSGLVGEEVPAGSRVRSDDGDVFLLSSNITIGADNTAVGTFIAEATGPLSVAIGGLSSFVDAIPNIDSVTNEIAASIGSNREANAQYRVRYFRELFKNASGVLESIVGAISSNVSGVTDINGAENDTGAPVVAEGITIPANSIAIVVEGGDSTEIASAILSKKTGGTGTFGEVTTSLARRVGPNASISFLRPAYVDVVITVVTVAGPAFPVGGLQLLEQRLIDYINGDFNLSPEDDVFFETDGLMLGESLNSFRLATPLNSVPGHNTSSVLISRRDGTPGGNVAVNLNEKIRVASVDDVNITVS